MAEESKSKKDKPKPKPKPDAQASAKAPKKEKAAKTAKTEKPEKAEKAAKDEAAAAEAPKAPRPPADPRLKYIKKFQGRFLPKGALRDRHKAIIERWNSGEDHGGITADELKSLYTDWRASKTTKKAKSATV